MPATVIETNQTPFETVEVDPVDLDIIENALRSARVEMDAVLFRTAMSPGIREQHDEFPLIANRDGKMVVGQFGAFINTFLKNYEGEIEEGWLITVTVLLSTPTLVTDAVTRSTVMTTSMPPSL